MSAFFQYSPESFQKILQIYKKHKTERVRWFLESNETLTATFNCKTLFSFRVTEYEIDFTNTYEFLGSSEGEYRISKNVEGSDYVVYYSKVMEERDFSQYESDSELRTSQESDGVHFYIDKKYYFNKKDVEDLFTLGILVSNSN